MDTFKIIQHLYAEKRRIDKAIAALEELATGKTTSPESALPVKKPRGRPRKNPPPASS